MSQPSQHAITIRWGNRHATIKSCRITRRGLSIVEVSISSMLVGVMLVAAMTAAASVFRTRLATRQQQQGKALARELMAEIFQVSYQDPQGGTTFGLESGESGSNRANFDDMDDYDQYTDSPPQDKAGNLVPNCTGWSRHVDIVFALPNNPQNSHPNDTGLKRITITVTAPSGKTAVLIAYRSSAGANEYIPPTDHTYITGVRGEVQIGSGSRSATGQAPVVNQAEDN